MDIHDFKDVAENYDLYIDILEDNTNLNTSDCINFHTELAKIYGQYGIADLGCGTGLVLIPLMEKGYEVYGVDISEEMINVTRTKVASLFKDKNNLICSHMKDFRLKKQVSLIIIPRSGFMHILKASEQIETLKNINSNLLLGGVLSLNTFFPSYELIAQNGKGKVKEPTLRDSFINKTGNKVEIYTFMGYNYENQIIEGKWIFKEFNYNGEMIDIRERPIKMRWTFKSEMDLLFNLCGFEVIKIYGGYDKSQACYPGNIIWVVKKVRDV